MRTLVLSAGRCKSRTRPSSMMFRPISGSTISRSASRMASALAGSCDSACHTRRLDAGLSDMIFSRGYDKNTAIGSVEHAGGLLDVGVKHLLNNGLVDGAHFGMALADAQIGAAIFGQ